MSTVSQAPIEIKFIDKTGAQKSALVSATVASFQTESGEWVDRRFLGVSPELVWVKGSISQTPGILWDNSVSIVSSLASFPAEIFGLAVNLTSSEPRDESGPVSVIGIGRLTGDLAASDEYDLMSKVAITLSLLGSLNLFMFIFNLVPILPLDGGHVAGALYGGVKMAWAKIRRKPEPWPTDTAAMLPVAYVVTMGLILMSAVVILADLIKPLNIF
jgi:membrane-associated protease RseP (regulator of RpoE activity)